MGDQERATQILLVHGTWGRRSGWTRRDSKLHTRLSDEFPGITIGRFEWSGSNRHHQRAKAASRLFAVRRGPYDRTVLIGHSHGGNVIERAMSLLDPDRVGAVTVGTPFLRFEPRRSDRLERAPMFSAARLLGLLVGVAVGATFLGAQLSLGVEPVDREITATVPLNGFSRGIATTALFSGAAVLLPLLFVMVPALIAAFVPRLSTIAALRSRRSRSRTQVEKLFDITNSDGFVRAMHTSGESDNMRIRTIKTHRDEAGILLRCGRVLGRAVDATQRVVGPMANLSSFMSITYVGAVMSNEDIWSGEFRWSEMFEISALQTMSYSAESFGAEGMSIAMALIVGVGVVGLLLSAVAMAEALLCGFDGSRYLRRGRIQMGDSPLLPSTSSTVTLTTKFGLRHTRLMSDPASIDAIVRACRSILDDLDEGVR